MSLASLFSKGRLALVAVALGFAGSAEAQILCFRAELDGAQEVPPNASSATGTAFFIMDQAANTLTYDIQYNGITGAENNAHIHGPSSGGGERAGHVQPPLGKTPSRARSSSPKPRSWTSSMD